MPKSVAAIVGAVLLVAGLGVAIVHYTVNGSAIDSYITLAVAAVLFVTGWALLDWGAGVSRRRGPGEEKRNGPKHPPNGDGM